MFVLIKEYMIERIKDLLEIPNKKIILKTYKQKYGDRYN